jgi:nucleoside-diphosphate kinase
MTSQRTLVLIKPDGVQRLLAGRILSRFEDRGLKIAAMKLMPVSKQLAETHYAVHSARPFFAGLVQFITSGPVVALVLEGPNAIVVVRSMVGATKPHEAVPGTIRGDFGFKDADAKMRNVCHASDSVEAAQAELKRFFKDGEIFAF